MQSEVSEQARTPPIDRPGTLKDRAYQEIKKQLVSGQLEHNRLYSAQYFAELLGISRTPARDALLQLANEGFLVCLDVRGFKIREFSAKEIDDVFQAREVIETYVAGELVGELSAEDFERLQESLQRMVEHAARDDVFAFLEADKDFHMTLVRRQGNHLLESIMDDIRSYLSLFGVRVLAHKGRFQEVVREHQRILDALRRQDRKKVVQAVRDHLIKTKHYLVSEET
jgi:DNA-binding GntR family transcriptional regulator